MELKVLKARVDQVPIHIWIVFGTAFVVCVVDGGIGLFAQPAVREAIVPQTGWAPSNVYLPIVFLLGFTLSPTPSARRGKVALGCLVFMLMIPVLTYLYFMFVVGPQYHSTNPYIRMGEYRWVWSVVLPCALAALMLSQPSIRYFTRSHLT